MVNCGSWAAKCDAQAVGRQGQDPLHNPPSPPNHPPAAVAAARSIRRRRAAAAGLRGDAQAVGRQGQARAARARPRGGSTREAARRSARAALAVQRAAAKRKGVDVWIREGRGTQYRRYSTMFGNAGKTLAASSSFKHTI
eukprot:366092-Chlamydomonas_euryale.AAC.1